jgi:hypothetical protein
MSNSYDVDIAHIRARTLIAVLLAVGAVLQTVGGALLLNAGMSPHVLPTMNIMGADVPTSTLGAVALCTSALWGYLAYLARPQGGAKAEAKPVAPRHDAPIEIHDFSLSVPPDTARANSA